MAEGRCGNRTPALRCLRTMPRALLSLLLFACGTAPPSAACPRCATCAEAAPSTVEPAPPDAPPSPDLEVRDEAHAVVEAGACDLRGVPESMRVALDAEASERLARRVEGWLNEQGGFVATPRAGVLFAKSEDDLGADPPYPTHVLAQGVHACGVSARWLVSASRATMRARAGADVGPVRCQGNVCCYSARGEYDSAGGVVFAQSEHGHFVIRAVYQVADNGTLGAEFVAEQYRVVHDHLARLRGQACRAEPASPGG